MKVKLAYGKEGLELSLPDSLRAVVLESVYTEGLPDPESTLREALRRPIGCAPLSELARGEGKIGIVFSDITRPTPNRLLVGAILDELGQSAHGRVVLFNATGTHRANTPDELETMLGEEIASHYPIVQNDSGDRGSHLSIGSTTGGNEAWLHREYMNCQIKILTGFIEPHFFAGFSGGGKACMPGLAHIDTILRNHSVANLDNPKASWGVTAGNPVFEEIRQVTALAEPAFLVNVTLNRDKRVTGVFAGDWRLAHEAGCSFVRERAMLRVGAPFDIVVGSNSGYPLDLNLYQSVKGMSAAANIIKPGGAIIVAADCWDGIPEHGEFARLLREAASIDDLLAALHKPGFQSQDMWQAQLLALICKKAEVYVYSRNLSDGQIKGAHLRPCRDIEATVHELAAKVGPAARVGVLPEGPQTVPYISA
ncbi:nickel-dependent lactate racemase [bacterium]|nr:nickel-dependent lactate racemase [bacterium]